ncbi:MAG: DUF4238 domain-containing protein [Campylobacterota bacterium]
MEKNKQIKRNHHYVWSHYLKSWAKVTDVFYISKKGKISKDSIKGLAKEIDFYKINPLNIDDIEYIKRFSAMSPDFLQEMHMSHLQYFIKLSNVSNTISQSKIYSKDLELLNNVIKHNSLENLHSLFEDTAVKAINELSKGNKNILDTATNMISFCTFLGHQLTRTKRMKERSSDAINMSMPFTNEALLFEKNWWFLSFMLGINVGWSLYESKTRNKHIYITNNTDIPFITSDNPIINVHSSVKGLNEFEAPEYADFFIPLSPKYAYMINDSSDYDHLELSISAEEVKNFNQAIYEKSHKTVFASEESALKDMKANKF